MSLAVAKKTAITSTGPSAWRPAVVALAILLVLAMLPNLTLQTQQLKDRNPSAIQALANALVVTKENEFFRIEGGAIRFVESSHIILRG